MDLGFLHTVNQQAVSDLIRRYSEASNGFDVANIVIANAEFLARLVVDMADTPVKGAQMAQLIQSHMAQTLIAGYTAKGFNTGAEVH